MGDTAFAKYQVTLCDHICFAGSYSSACASSANCYTALFLLIMEELCDGCSSICY